MDLIPITKDVMFVGEYFSLITSVQPDESLRAEGETDDDFAVRVASVLFAEHYGWDVLEVSQEIGVIDRDPNEDEDGDEDG